MNCPVCSSQELELFDQDKFRSYQKCLGCKLVYVPRNNLISTLDEKTRYDSHEIDLGYEKYLTKISESILPHVSSTLKGLDFGSGKTEFMAQLFKNHGIHVDSFDKYFLPTEIWDKKFDFIILSEVIEHLREPMIEMEKLKELLNPNGQFFIKTKFLPLEKEDFKNWFYKRDITHIQFFDPESMKYLARRLGFSFKEIGEDLYLFAMSAPK